MPNSARFERIDAIGVITLENPPVNALSLAVRTAVRDALAEGTRDPGVLAFVITGGGKLFSGGADIREFDSGVSNQSPNLPELIALVEDSAKPVVAALHGTAVGGGCELPLGCHARVAMAGTQIGLPEVTLGLVPGAGGTQRLPRLIGVQAALDAIVTGKFLSAEKAHELGLVDALVPKGGDLVKAALTLAQQLASAKKPPVKTRDREECLAEGRANPGLFAEARKAAAKRFRGFEAPLACIACVEAAVTMPFAQGLAFERDTFQHCRTSSQSKAQRHAFFAEREARRVRGVSDDTKEFTIRRGAVLGCGTMGGGIAMCFANAGIPVMVTEGDRAALDRGMDTIRKNYASSVSKGSLSAADAEGRLALIEPTLDFDRVSGADIVIEAVSMFDLPAQLQTKSVKRPVMIPPEPMTLRIVTRQYFQAMGMRLVEGRTFAEAGAAPYQELILSEEFVRRYFPGKSPLGQILTAGPARYQVVGVVNDARQSGLNAKLRSEYYVDLTRFGLTQATRPHFVVRSGADTSHLGPLIRSTVRDIDPRLGVDLNQQTMAELTSASVATPRFNTFVLSAFAAVALALAIVGIYGVLSHAVTRRTHEIGIRMAVGAVPSRVLAMILRQSLMVTGTGAVVGLLMAAGTTRYLESMLFELTPLDPWTFVAVAVMTLVVAVLAAYPPAARASRVDPLAALRHD